MSLSGKVFESKWGILKLNDKTLMSRSTFNKIRTQKKVKCIKKILRKN